MRLNNEKGFAAVLEVILIATVILVAGSLAYRIYLDHHHPSNLRFEFPKAQYSTNDNQYKILKAEEAKLNMPALGLEYYRNENHQGITGGFYAGQKIGATVDVCYIPIGSLSQVQAKLDADLASQGWKGDGVYYRKETSEGEVVESLDFPQKTDDHSYCGGVTHPEAFKGTDSNFEIDLHY